DSATQAAEQDIFVHKSSYRASRKARAQMVQKHRVRRLQGTRLLESCIPINLECLQTVLAKRHDPLFAAFAADQNHSLSEIDVFPIQPGKLAHANSTSVKELKNPPVSQAQR